MLTRITVAVGAIFLLLPLQATSQSVVASQSEIRQFLGGSGGLLFFTDSDHGGQLKYIDIDDPSLTIQTLDSSDCRDPRISLDGTRVVYGVNGILYARWIASGDRVQIANVGTARSKGVGYWYEESGQEYIIYCDSTEKYGYDSGNTYRVRIQNGIEPDGAPEQIYSKAYDGGITPDGVWIGEAYGDRHAYNLVTGQEYANFYIAGGGTEGQCCNGSMAPMTGPYRMTTLVLPHSMFRTWEYNSGNDRWEEYHVYTNPSGTDEWQCPEWSLHPDYITVTAKQAGYDLYIHNVHNTSSRIKVIEGDVGTSHLYVGTSQPVVHIDGFGADPDQILAGASSTLTWSTTHATSVQIDPGVGGVGDDSTTSVTPADTTTYTLTAEGPGGPKTAQATVTVVQPECTDGETRGCGTDEGACESGTETCQGGSWGACQGGVQPSSEACNGLDDDCDGDVPAGEADADGDGHRGCAGDCDDDAAGVNPDAAEACNAVDDNCDGTVDEGCECNDGDTRPCGSDEGACQPGAQSCTAGAWGGCQGAVGPVDESCNSVDDDCDGQTDEGCSVPPEMRINCGSNDYDVDGWERDDAYVTSGSDWTNPGAVAVDGVTDAAPADVYRSVRHASPHSYDIPVPDGRYTLRLHFADAYDDGRQMNYAAEGAPILTDFDIASEAGGPNRALVREFTLEVAGGFQLTATSEGDVFEAGLELVRVVEDDGGTQEEPGVVTDGGDQHPPADSARPGSDEVVIQGACGCRQASGPGSALLLLLALTWVGRLRYQSRA